MLEKIKSLSEQWADDAINMRRHIHANPELSYQEFETAAYICKQLDQWGISYTVMAETGICGIIEGKDPQSRIVALRADMDALPIQEENDVPYRSTRTGIMHACGHDVHTACLLGAARILQHTRTEWSGTVKLIFQPGEEKNPGGASLMIRDGVLKNPVPQKIFGLHVHPGMEAGQFSLRGGKVMASADEIYITVKAKGGHAAAPQHTGDTILAASQIVVALQQVASRRNDPFNPTVLSITSFQGGNTTNVIPGQVNLMGTLRAMDETWRFQAHTTIQQIAENTAKAFGTTAEVRIDIGYPFVWNDPELTERAKQLAMELAGKEQVSETELRMGAEDFAFYSHQIPACFFRLGAGNKALQITSNVHTATFNVDERAIQQGMAMMAWLAVSA